MDFLKFVDFGVVYNDLRASDKLPEVGHDPFPGLAVSIDSGITGLFLAVFIIFYFKYHWCWCSDIPPGPRGLPFLGYVPFFGPNPPETFLKLGKKYGNVFSMYMGPQLTIVLNDYDSIKTAFGTQANVFSGRAYGFVSRHISQEDDGKSHGIAFQEGKDHSVSRRFMSSTFRHLGLGSSKLQDHILLEVEYLIENFAKNEKTIFDPYRPLFACAANIISTLCFGQRFDCTDPEFVKHLDGLEVNSMVLAQAGPLQAYPVLRFMPGRFSATWKSIVETTKRSKTFFRNMVQQHRENQRTNEIGDYIDAFLQRQQKEKASTTGLSQVFQDNELYQNLRVFFLAGTEATAVTLQWALLYMIYYPDVQKQIHRQLDENIEAQKPVRVDDRSKLPYLEAVIREVQRLANVTPFGILRTNVEETTLFGFRVPKRSYIMPNYLAVNTDPKLWTDPMIFNPNRFLDADGKLHDPPHFIPFSLGKRACVGESLARLELFLVFANVLQRFQIGKPKDSCLPLTSQCITGVSRRPLPFKIEVISRHLNGEE